MLLTNSKYFQSFKINIKFKKVKVDCHNKMRMKFLKMSLAFRVNHSKEIFNRNYSASAKKSLKLWDWTRIKGQQLEIKFKLKKIQNCKKNQYKWLLKNNSLVRKVCNFIALKMKNLFKCLQISLNNPFNLRKNTKIIP